MLHAMTEARISWRVFFVHIDVLKCHIAPFYTSATAHCFDAANMLASFHHTSTSIHSTREIRVCSRRIMALYSASINWLVTSQSSGSVAELGRGM